MSAMKVGRRLLGFVTAVAAAGLLASCTFPTPSKDYACENDSDCDPERVCSPARYCVLASAMEPDAGTTDAAPVDSMLPADADPFAAIAAQCIAAGYAKNATTNSYYRVSTQEAPNWQSANDDCANDVANATHLITISDLTEITYMMSYNDYWVGWIDRPVEGMWHVLTDEVTVINLEDHWGGSRPDGGGSENCAVWRNSVGGKPGFDDVDCPQDHRYVCECDGRPITKPFM